MGLASVSSPCPPVLLPSLLPKELNQQGPLAPATLLAFFATVSPSDSLSPSTHFPVSPVIGPLFSGRFLPGRGGSPQLLSLSLPTCRRYNPAEAVRPSAKVGSTRAAFAARSAARPSGRRFSRPFRVHFRYGL